MIQNTTNILDQLLGGFETQPTGPAAGTPAAGTGAASFVDLLGLLTLGGDSSLDGLTAAIPQSADEAAEGSTEPMVVVEQIALSLQPAVTGQVVANDTPAVAPEATDAATPECADSEVTPEMSAVLAKAAAFRAFDVVNMNENVKALLGGQPQPESASYKILDARVVDDNLELTVMGGEDKASLVSITVPVDLVRKPQQVEARPDVSAKADATPTTKTAAPVSQWEDTVSADLTLDELMSRVNLKALEIRVATTDPEMTATPTKAAVNLVAEVGGQQLVLKNKLDTQKVLVRKTDEPSGTAQPQISRPPVNGGSALTGEPPTQPESHLSPRLVAVPSKNTALNLSLDPADQLTTGLGKVGAQTIAVNGQTAPSQTASGEKNMTAVAPQVRLYVTEPIQPQARTQGQTLMLKIEPESLGPAKLNLTMRQDGLTARVTVETPVAKAAVENSLDQLTQQLSRAGVQVQRIEVALDGGAMRHQFFERRPEWSHGHGRSSARFARESESEQVTSSAVRSPSAYGYLRRDGVNLLA